MTMRIQNKKKKNICEAATYTFCRDLITVLKEHNFRGPQVYYTEGGQPNLLQYQMGGGGSTKTLKMYYVIYEEPL